MSITRYIILKYVKLNNTKIINNCKIIDNYKQLDTKKMCTIILMRYNNEKHN